MDAQVAYGFHHLRDERPYLAQGPITNKVWGLFLFVLTTYQSQSCLYPSIHLSNWWDASYEANNCYIL